MDDIVALRVGKEERLVNLNASRFVPLSPLQQQLFVRCKEGGFVLPMQGMKQRKVGKSLIGEIADACGKLIAATDETSRKLKLKVIRKMCQHTKLQKIWIDSMKMTFQLGEGEQADDMNIIFMLGQGYRTALTRQAVIMQLADLTEKIGVKTLCPEIILQGDKVKLRVIEGRAAPETMGDWFEPVIVEPADEGERENILRRRMYTPRSNEGSPLNDEEGREAGNYKVSIKTPDGWHYCKREEWNTLQALMLLGQTTNSEAGLATLEEGIEMLSEHLLKLKYKKRIQQQRLQDGWHGDECRLAIPINDQAVKMWAMSQGLPETENIRALRDVTAQYARMASEKWASYATQYAVENWEKEAGEWATRWAADDKKGVI